MKKLSVFLSLLLCLSATALGQTGPQPYGDLYDPVTLTQTIYTPANAPATPALQDLPLQSSVTQYGITWTFNQPVRVGQFITGDYYVVGPVTVVNIDPAPIQGVANLIAAGWTIIQQDAVDEVRYGDGVGRHGSMLNATGTKILAAGGKYGFDSRLAHVHYSPTCFEAPPFALQVGDALISTISNDTMTDFRGYGQPVLTAAILTCMAEPVPPDAFRPSYADMTNRIYLARNLKRNLLYNLPLPASAPNSMETWIRRFHRPWIDFSNWGYAAPLRNMPRYGQLYTEASSNASLMLHLDYPAEQKEKLLVEIVQYGIDNAGLLRSGFTGWRGHGGFGDGRKWLLTFAGLMLDDDEMKWPNDLNPNAVFGEDMKTSWGAHWNGYDNVFESHPDWRPIPSETIQPFYWTNDNRISETYRIANTSREYGGQALAARLMRAEAYREHDPFFAYTDRWMSEDLHDTVQTWVYEMALAAGWDPETEPPPAMPWYYNAPHANVFVQAMWDTYRYNLPDPLVPPVEPVDVVYQVAASGDDVHCSQWNNSTAGSTMYISYGNDGRRAFLKWQLDIPPGSTINSAHLEVRSQYAYSTAGSVRVQAIDADSCGDLASSIPYNLPVDAEYADWQFEPWTNNTWYSSSDISNVIQSFVDRPGYAAGNYLGLRVQYLSGTYRSVFTFDNQPEDGAVLVVNYTPPSEPVEATYQVAASADDMDCSLWNNNTAGSTMWISYGNDGRRAFMRWQIDVPAGATINSAYLTTRSQYAYSSAGSIRLQAIDSDNCPTFAGVTPFNWAVNTAYADWVFEPWMNNQWYISPDLAAIVQEVVNRPGYASGSYLGLRAAHLSGTYRSCWTFDHLQDDAPMLIINYTP